MSNLRHVKSACPRNLRAGQVCVPVKSVHHPNLRSFHNISVRVESLRVEFLLKTDSGYPKDTGANKPWQPLGIPFAITPIGQLHQSPPSPIPGDLGRGLSHQSHVLEHRDTYGQAQVCSKGHQGSSLDRPCQPSFHWIKFWHIRNLLPQNIRLLLSVLVCYWVGQGE